MQNYTPVRRLSRNGELGAVVAYCLDRAGVERFLAEFQFFGSFRLLVNVGVAVFVVAGEISRRSITADIAIDTLRVDVKFAPDIVGQFVFRVGHKFC
jgi:hypothetical protein